MVTQDPVQSMKLFQEMKEVNQLIRDNPNYWEDTAKYIALDLGNKVTRYITTGFGTQKAVADEIGLKLIEVVGESATSYGLEEFTHGPSATFRKDLGIILFQTDQRTLEKTVQIAHGIALSDARLVVITDKPEAGWPAIARLIIYGNAKSSNIWPVSGSCSCTIFSLLSGSSKREESRCK